MLTPGPPQGSAGWEAAATDDKALTQHLARQTLVGAAAAQGLLALQAAMAALALSSFATLTLSLRLHQQQVLQQSLCLVGSAFINGPLQVPSHSNELSNDYLCF
jgi:hypothetical protein